MTVFTRRGLMLVLSSPSGAGKTTIVNDLLNSERRLKTSVSVTTRPKRLSEIDGRDYYFVSPEEFNRRIEAGDFFEHAEVFGNMYGTPRQFVMDSLTDGDDVVFDIDWQGTQQISQSARDDLVTIFILPPSLEELELRLRGRNQDSEDIIRSRMQEASAELSHWAEYNYIVVNYDLHESVKIVKSILEAERYRRKRQVGLASFVNNMRILPH
ncbi:MAG: guanylate kinase [Candidatus Paracaedibacteraceae bacterium]|nr:guanylate kinase [Candidatus Paracaedibacteraceae bacterium]